MGGEYWTELKAQRRSYREVQIARTVQSFYAVCGSRTCWRQTGTEQSPLFANFDRDLWSVQLSYRFHEIALGK